MVIWIRGHQAFAANLCAKFGKLTRKSLLLPGEGVLYYLHVWRCSGDLSGHYGILVQAKLVSSWAYPLEDPQPAQT